MNRNLGIERVYNLGDYKSLRVIDYINDVPEDLMLDTDAVDKIRYLQLISLDLVYERYAVLSKKQVKEDAMLVLLEERANVMEELKQLFNNTKKENI